MQVNQSLSLGLQQIQQDFSACFPGIHFEFFSEIDSTSSETMRRARAGNYASVVVLAASQTAGRGRMGKTWFSLGQALTFSVGMPYRPRSWMGLSLVVGLSVAQSLDPQGDFGLQIKWPNDVWWRGRKLAGILVETLHTQSMTGRDPYVVIGIGINVALPAAAESQTLATTPAYLQEFQAKCTVAQAFALIFPALLRDLTAFTQHGFAPLLPAFAQRDALYGKMVVCSDGNQGLAQGVDTQGALLLQDKGSALQSVVAAQASVRVRD